MFIEERRRALAAYLQRLVGLSRTASNADIRSFLRITEKAGSSAGGPPSGRGSRRGERVALHGDAVRGTGRGSRPATAVNAMVTMPSSGGRNVRDAARRASANPYGVEDDDEVAEGEAEAPDLEVRRSTVAEFLGGGEERPALTIAAAGSDSPPPPPPPGRLGPLGAASAGVGAAAEGEGEQQAGLSIALM